MRTGLMPVQATGPQPRGRLRAFALGASILAHGAVIAGLLWLRFAPPHTVPASAAITVRLLPKPPAPPASEQLDAGALPNADVPLPRLAPPALVIMRTVDTSDLMTAGQLAGASDASAAGGSGGGGCAMAQAVQQALRRDPLVRAAVQDADRLGKASMVWDGDWVRTGDQEGKGLSAVREAISWAVAFAPQACRNEPVHGLVLLSLADGATRFGVGAGSWRWSDLLGVR
jgi:hypothetical protein